MPDMSDVEMVDEFIKAKGASHDPKLWLKLIAEERDEFYLALAEGNDVELLDAICDLKYVLNGYAISRHWDLDGAYAEVHRSNMTKESGNTREDGKILKGQHYEAPMLEQFMPEIWSQNEPKTS